MLNANPLMLTVSPDRRFRRGPVSECSLTEMVTSSRAAPGSRQRPLCQTSARVILLGEDEIPDRRSE